MAGPVLVAAIDTLNSSIGKAIGKLENIISTSEKAQQATLSLGQSLGGGFNSLGTSMDDLNGSFGQRLQVGITGMQVGLQGNTAGVLKLLNEQQLLGQEFKKTAKLIARFEATLGLSRDESEKLGETLSQTSKSFGVSISTLVQALDGIKNLPGLRAAGLGGLPEAVTKLAGQFGPALQGELKSFLGLFTDTSMEAFSKLSQLGIGDVRERFSAAGPEAQVKILEKAIAQAGRRIKQFDQGAESFFGKLSIADGLFGQVSNSIRALTENIGTREQVQQKNKGLFTQQFAVMKANLFAPFEMLFSQKVFPQLSKFVSILAESVNPFLQGLTDKVRALGDSSKMFNKLLVISNSVIKGTIKFFNFLISGINSTMITFKILSIALTPLTVTIKAVVKAFGLLLEATVFILDKISFFTGGLVDGLADSLRVNKLNKLDPEQFDLLKAQERLLRQIAENTDEEALAREKDVPSQAMRRSMEILNNTLYQISREAVDATVAEETRDLTADIARSMAQIAEDNSLPKLT